MRKLIRAIGEYRILQVNQGYVVVNTKGQYHNHGHFKKLATCYVIIGLMQKRLIPNKPYMLESARRLTIEPEYLAALINKQNKPKQRYYNANNRKR